MVPSRRDGSPSSSIARPVAPVLVLALCAGGGAAAPAALAQPAAPPDLVVARVDRSAATGDWQALRVGGVLAATVSNRGVGAAGPFEVAFYADADGDGALDPAADTPLGRAAAAGLAPGESAVVQAAAGGIVPFRDPPLFALADAGRAVAERDERGNAARWADRCAAPAAPRSFAPVLEWAWTDGPAAPTSNQAVITPAIADLDLDGVPEVAFATFPPTFGDASNYEQPAVLRAVRGDDGRDVLAVTDPSLAVRANGGLAIADVDRDEAPEILALDPACEHVLAFRPDGSLLWRSERLAGRIGSPSVADLDADGAPEVLVGPIVLDESGRVRWAIRTSAATGRGTHVNHDIAVPVDLDLDGRLEVLSGNAAFRADGSTYWHAAGLPDGFVAVADLDGDPWPEVVLVAQGNLYALEHDGAPRWGPVALPGGTTRNRGGPPMVADLDGDGAPEIGVAGGTRYTVFGADGSVRWSSPIVDPTSNSAGGTAFDFDQDGAWEVVYADETRLRVFDGRDGWEIWTYARGSSTQIDNPVVADVDGDGQAEIAVTANDFFSGRARGVLVFGDAARAWAPTHPRWNQHAYHVDNIGPLLDVPRFPAPSWLGHNTFRVNPPLGPPGAALPDLTASRIDVQPRPDGSASLTGRVGNGGAAPAPAGTPIRFFAGDPAAGGAVIGVASLPADLAPGRWLDVSATWDAPPGGDVLVTLAVDRDAAGGGTVLECDETNNVHRAAFELPPAPTPTPTRTPTASPTPTATPPRRYAFLPVAGSGACLRAPVGADVVLVLDASSSMAGAKLDAAQAAARSFLDRMDLGAGGDRAALVTFNAGASLLQPLTADRAALASALGGIPTAQGTAIDAGLEAARAALASSVGERRRQVVLLTDGRHNGTPGADRAAAAALWARGTRTDAIGLGDDADPESLRALAGLGGRYLQAPRPEDLAAVFDALAAEVLCAR